MAKDKYSLDFCIHRLLPDDSFDLIYDTDPDGAGEQIPVDDTDSVERIFEIA